jgi:polysaccharide chain length determinant protein (PEP-CTERM system associated)
MLPGKVYRPEDILQILKKRIWFLLLPFAVVSAATAVWAHRLPDRYRSDTLIMVVPQRVPESYVRSTVTTRIEDRLQSISQQILSRTRLERIIQELNLYAEERKDGIMEDIVEQMRTRDVHINVVRGDSFRIGYEGNDARTVKGVTEALASLFIEENLRERAVLAEGTSVFLESQLEEVRRRLIEQEKRVADYRQRFAGQLPTQLESNLQVLQSVQVQIQSIMEAINSDRNRRLLLERQIADLEQQQATEALAPPPAPAVAADGTTSSLTQQLASAKAALGVLELRLKAEHPDVQRAARRVLELEQRVEQAAQDAPVSSDPIRRPPAELARARRLDELRQEIAQLDRQLAKRQQDEQRLRGQAAAFEARVEATPTRESEMIELTRDYTTLQALYTNLVGKKEESKISANLEQRQVGEQFKMLDPARVPERPFSPNRVRLNAIGMAGGLGLGLLLIGLLEYRDRTLKTDDEIAQLLSLPVLAVVPLMQSAAEAQWAFRKRLVLGLGFGATVAGCLAIVAYTLIA